MFLPESVSTRLTLEKPEELECIEYSFLRHIKRGDGTHLAQFSQPDLMGGARYLFNKEMCVMHLSSLMKDGLPHEHISASLLHWPADKKPKHSLFLTLKQLIA